MKLTIYPAKQKHHPDAPSDGWTIDVHDNKGQLFSRIYGFTELAAWMRSRKFIAAMERAGHDVEVQS